MKRIMLAVSIVASVFVVSALAHRLEISGSSGFTSHDDVTLNGAIMRPGDGPEPDDNREE